MASKLTSKVQVQWHSLPVAAEALGLSPGALRKILERNARRGEDGGVEALIDGVCARKLGRLWRVCFSAAWSDPQLAASRPPRHTPPSSQNARDDREGSRS